MGHSLHVAVLCLAGCELVVGLMAGLSAGAVAALHALLVVCFPLPLAGCAVGCHVPGDACSAAAGGRCVREQRDCMPARLRVCVLVCQLGLVKAAAWAGFAAASVPGCGGVVWECLVSAARVLPCF